MNELQEALNAQNELFSNYLANCEMLLENGEIDEDDYEQMILEAREDLIARQDEILGVEYDDEEEDELEYADATYSNGADYAEFSAGNPYATALLELGADEFYDSESDEYDVEGLCVALGEAQGYDPEDILAILQGQLEATDDFSLDVAEAFQLDENTATQLLALGIESRGESIEDYLDDEDEDLEDDDEELPITGEANYSRVDHLEQELATFKAAAVINTQLNRIEQRAWELVEEGRVTPAVAESFIGNFSDEDDRLAFFSTGCKRSGIDPETQLYAMQLVVKTLESMPPLAEFGYNTLEEMTPDEIEEEETIVNVAADILKFRQSNR